MAALHRLTMETINWRCLPMLLSTLYILSISALFFVTAQLPQTVSAPSMDSVVALLFVGYCCFAAYAAWILPEELHHAYGWDFGSN